MCAFGVCLMSAHTYRIWALLMLLNIFYCLSKGRTPLVEDLGLAVLLIKPQFFSFSFY